MKDKELPQRPETVTIEYLLAHGFEPYNKEQSFEITDMPFDDDEDSKHFREMEFHRQMCVVVFSAYNGDPIDGYNKQVYFQDNVGCGFVPIPFPWWDLSVEYFEAVYYGIRGHKPKFNPAKFADIPHEVVTPKQIEK